MAFDAGTRRSRQATQTVSPLALGPEGDWAETERPPRDWKKIVLVAGLGALSWVATYVGMLELIEANMGDLPLVHKAIIGFSVAMLMTMIVWLLDQMFAPIGWFTRLSYAAGYIFLTLISVGFGFGFYWKVLESRSEASRSAESAITQVQGSLHAASTRLEQLQTTLEQLTAVSNTQAEIERTKGTSCPNSKPGDGPRRRLRDEDAARFSFASEFVKTRVGTVKGEMGALDADLAKIAGDDKSIVDAKSGTRNEFMKTLGRKLDMTVTGFNAFRTDPQLRQIRTDLAERAEKTTFIDTKGQPYACPDPQLQTALRGVVRAIDQLPELAKPQIAAVEGSEATIEAFRRLTATFYGVLSFKLPPSADELRDLQKKAVQSVEQAPQRPTAVLEQGGLSKRDYVPLAVALFVDLCLLLVSMGRPMNRLDNLVPKMREAERGPVIQILSRFNDIHRDEQVRENFELFRHVVFDFHGDYYVAVPMDAPRRMNPAQREDLRLETQLLANLFASFENEKIFTRVMTPLLTTSTIQKRLRRQGSKFAESDAFRVYRFKDGAWSQIILGAVMGAAKRVEAEKRRRRVEEEIFRPDPEPGLGAPHETTRPSAAMPGPHPSAVSPASVHAAMHGGGRPTQPHTPVYAPAAAGPYAAAYGAGTHELAPHPRHPHMPAGAPAGPAVHSAQFGPYAAYVRPQAPVPPQEPGAPFTVRPAPMPDIGAAANNNTATHARRPEPQPTEPARGGEPAAARTEPGPGAGENVIVLPSTPRPQAAPAVRPAATTVAVATPAPQAAPAEIILEPAAAAKSEERIDIVVKRETATFSVPVSEAVLPQALMRAGLLASAAAAPSRPAVEITMSEPVASATAMPPAIKAQGATALLVIEPEPAREPRADDAATDWSVADAEMMSRFAKVPAE